jgi:deoxyribonuclease-1
MFLLLLSLTAPASDLPASDLPAYEELVPEVPSFTTAKKRMYAIHDGVPTLYCGCPFKSKTPDLAACGLDSFEGTRWERTEAEHVVPASAIGSTRPCWDEGGRDHCISVDPVYKAAHNDLHNLYPAVGQINLYRSNNSMGLIADEEWEYGECDFEVDTDADRVEPRTEVRGDIARIYFYMEWMYGVPISEGQRRLFLHWHQTDPVSETEKARDEAIEAKQGNPNPFVR